MQDSVLFLRELQVAPGRVLTQLFGFCVHMKVPVQG